MSKLTELALAANKDYPHLSNHELVLELVELEKQVIGLQKAVSILLSERQAEKE